MALTVKYLGDHKVECVHNESGHAIMTQAPAKDGSEATFSPTDLCAASLANCALTIMSFLADRHNLDITGAWAEVNKTMETSPSRIGSIEIIFHMPARHFSEKDRQLLKRAAEMCPIHKSLAAELQQVFVYHWGD